MPPRMDLTFPVTLKISFLRIANIPPPMCLEQLEMDDTMVDIAFSSDGTRLAVLAENNASLYALEPANVQPKLELLWRSPLPRTQHARHVAIHGGGNVAILSDAQDENGCSLWSNDGRQLSHRGSLDHVGSAAILFTDIDGARVFVQARNGSIHDVTDMPRASGSQRGQMLMAKFPSLASEARAISLGGHVSLHAAHSFFTHL